MAEGGIQYLDTWDNKPPVIGWFYAGFAWVFGEYALTAVRVFTCFYLFICALLINQLMIRNRFLERYPLAPGFVFLILTAVPWYAQELNAEMLMILPLILVMQQVYNVTENGDRNHQRLIIAGLLLGLCTLIKYQGFVFFLAFTLGHVIVNPPRFSEYFSLITGFFLTLLGVFLILFFNGSVSAWWDVGLVYNLDYMSIGENPGEHPSLWFNLLQYGKMWGAFVFTGLLGMALNRLNYFSMAIRLRRLDALFFTWFVGAVLTVALGGSRLYLHYFIAAAAPLSVYVGIFAEQRLSRLIRASVLATCLAGPVYTYGVFLSAAFPQTFSFADPWFEPMSWVKGLRTELNEPHPLAAHIDKSKVKNGILVMDDYPELYMKLGLPCATKYTNFSIAHYKISAFRHNEGRELFSNPEGLKEVYRQFSHEMPEYVVDPDTLFIQLKDKMPLLLQAYKPRKVGDYTLWSRVD